MGPADQADPAPDAGGGLQALSHLEAQRVDSDVVLPLRHAVLRPGRRWADAIYATDDDPLSAHFAVRQGATLLAVGSILSEPVPAQQSAPAWRVRGMAVRPDLRGYGLGAKVLGALMAHAECGSGTDVWCTARTSAAGFYESFGFVRNGVPEQVTGLGPHVFMSREVGSGHSE